MVLGLIPSNGCCLGVTAHNVAVKRLTMFQRLPQRRKLRLTASQRMKKPSKWFSMHPLRLNLWCTLTPTQARQLRIIQARKVTKTPFQEVSLTRRKGAYRRLHVKNNWGQIMSQTWLIQILNWGTITCKTCAGTFCCNDELIKVRDSSRTMLDWTMQIMYLFFFYVLSFFNLWFYLFTFFCLFCWCCCLCYYMLKFFSSLEVTTNIIFNILQTQNFTLSFYTFVSSVVMWCSSLPSKSPSFRSFYFYFLLLR